MTATLLDRAMGPVLSVAGAPLDAPVSSGDDPPTNVVEWDNVANLPWWESFDMARPPAAVATVIPRRRRVDTRTLADVVRAVAG